MKDFVLSSYRGHFFDSYDVKSEFPLSIYIILGILQLIEWIRQLATYIFVYIPSSLKKILLPKIAHHPAIITNRSF